MIVEIGKQPLGHFLGVDIVKLMQWLRGMTSNQVIKILQKAKNLPRTATSAQMANFTYVVFEYSHWSVENIPEPQAFDQLEISVLQLESSTDKRVKPK